MFSRSVLALVSTLATFVTCQDYNTSAPFTLKIISYDNSTLNGTSLFACHEGAAIEALCQPGQITTIPTSAQTFNFNTSSSQVAPTDPSIGITGILTFLLQGSNFNESEPLGLYTPLSSNVALPLFQPSSGIAVAFDSNNLLNVQDYVDDTVSPPTFTDAKAYYRWYVCTTYYSSYTYQTLNWILGEAPPQNPTCQKVDVQRVFV